MFLLSKLRTSVLDLKCEYKRNAINDDKNKDKVPVEVYYNLEQFTAKTYFEASRQSTTNIQCIDNFVNGVKTTPKKLEVVFPISFHEINFVSVIII